MNESAAFQELIGTENFDAFTPVSNTSLKVAGYVLSKPQAIALLEKLSTDDEFRARYTARPDQGLLEIGVPAQVVNEIDECLPPMGVLADKSVFKTALAQLRLDQVEVSARMHPPTIRLRMG